MRGRPRSRIGDVVVLGVAFEPGVVAVAGDVDDEARACRALRQVVGDLPLRPRRPARAINRPRSLSTVPVRASIFTSRTRPVLVSILIS